MVPNVWHKIAYQIPHDPRDDPILYNHRLILLQRNCDSERLANED